MDYRRTVAPGGTFFFTVVTWNRMPVFSDPNQIDLLRKAVSKVKKDHPFRIIAWVILPDHLHMIWRLPVNDSDYATRWRLIKSQFTHQWNGKDAQLVSRSRKMKHEAAVWQRRYWEHLIRDVNDLDRHIEYIHYNPVKHGVVKAPIAWPFSSFSEYVHRGIFTPEWGASNDPVCGVMVIE